MKRKRTGSAPERTGRRGVLTVARKRCRGVPLCAFTSERLTATVMVVMAVVATSVYAREVGDSARDGISVYVNNDAVPSRVLQLAEAIATKMFSSAGVRIAWRGHTPERSQLPARAIAITLAPQTPERFLPGALAFARPFEGVHITVFCDRIQQASRSASTDAVLAHVLAHEITHILQGIDRHSGNGVMKACWTDKDYRDMKWEPLPFTPEDVRLIRFGLAKRADGALVAANSAA